MKIVQRFARNERGRDFVVGDIHGAFGSLREHLEEHIGFDHTRGDRLFSVGDLIDRGPWSEAATWWLAQPWFHAVRGNHEELCIAGARAGPATHQTYVHMMNGGDWFYRLDALQQSHYVDAFARLPVAIEIEARIGLVHAQCPLDNWSKFTKLLEAGDKGLTRSAQWGRDRVVGPPVWIKGIGAVVSGHTILDEPHLAGNQMWIETAGWAPGGKWTVLDLEHI